jgi:hypothetical protein
LFNVENKSQDEKFENQCCHGRGNIIYSNDSDWCRRWRRQNITRCGCKPILNSSSADCSPDGYVNRFQWSSTKCRLVERSANNIFHLWRSE